MFQLNNLLNLHVFYSEPFLKYVIHKLNFQEKIFEEIFRIFGDFDCEVTMESLKLMEYTEMVIKETLRLYPVVPMYMREAQEDIELSKFICFK